MSGKLKHPINIRLSDQQYEDFLFICDTQKKDVSKVLRAFIDDYILRNDCILQRDQTCDLYVETSDGKREWITVLKEEVMDKGLCTRVESEEVFKKVKKLETE
jgi:hypothetical protein